MNVLLIAVSPVFVTGTILCSENLLSLKAHPTIEHLLFACSGSASGRLGRKEVMSVLHRSACTSVFISHKMRYNIFFKCITQNYCPKRGERKGAENEVAGLWIIYSDIYYFMVFIFIQSSILWAVWLYAND